MNKKTARGRLRIHRETLRTLSDARLARVAGGDLVAQPLTLGIFVLREDGQDAPLPRSNGWTTGDIDLRTC